MQTNKSSHPNGARIGKSLLGLLLATAFLDLGSLAVSAQTTSVSQQPSSQSSSVSKDDVSFLKDAYQGGLYEIEVGKYAASNGKSDVVKQFGQKMVDDHGALNQTLADLAQKEGVTLDTTPSALTTTKIKTATVLSGAAFDKTYVPMAIHDHKSDIKAFRTECDTTSNADIKAAVTKALPTLKHHLMMAKQAKATLANS